MPNMYFATQKYNPSPYDLLLTQMSLHTHFDETAQILTNNPPQCALVNYKMTVKFNYQTNNHVDLFLQQNYTTLTSWGGCTIINLQHLLKINLQIS